MKRKLEQQPQGLKSKKQKNLDNVTNEIYPFTEKHTTNTIDQETTGDNYRNCKERRVIVYGASAGDQLVGCASTAEQITLLVTSGIICGQKEAWYAVHGKEILPPSENLHLDDLPNHTSLGKNCRCKKLCQCEAGARFKILHPGKLVDHAKECGKEKELLELQQRDDLDWRDILQIVGKHTLALHRGWYCIVEAPKIIKQHCGLILWLTAEQFGLCEKLDQPVTVNKEQKMYLLPDISNSTLVGVQSLAIVYDSMAYNTHPNSNNNVDAEQSHYVNNNTSCIEKNACLQRNCIIDLAFEELLQFYANIKEDERTDLHAQYNLCLQWASRLSFGMLKSMAQKSIRMAPQTLCMPDNTIVVTPCFVAAVFALLVSCRGGLVPSLQMYCRGCTAAFKRLAVMLVEDVWIDDTKILVGLLGVALLSQKVNHWYPNQMMIRTLIKTALQAYQSTAVVVIPEEQQQQQKEFSSGVLQSIDQVIENEKNSKRYDLKIAAALIAIVKSFAGDEALFKYIAYVPDLATLFSQHMLPRPKQYDLYQFVDQHAQRYVAHLIPEKQQQQQPKREGKQQQLSLGDRMQMLFRHVTGTNFRKATVVNSNVLKNVSTSQRICLSVALKCFRSSLTQPKKKKQLPVVGETILPITLDPALLAAEVGPIYVKKGTRSFTVILPTQHNPDLQDEFVLITPSRDSRNKDLADVSEQDRIFCIENVRKRKHEFKSVYPIGTIAKFDPEQCCWCVNPPPTTTIDIRANGEARKEEFVAWATVCKQGAVVCFDLHPSIELDIDDDKQLALAFQTRGTGMVDDRKGALQGQLQYLVNNNTMQVLLRALSLMNQQWSTIKLPVPDLSGGLAPGEAQAYAYDSDVCRLLLRLSLLFPGALHPKTPVIFNIPNILLLRELENRLKTLVNEKLLAPNQPNRIGLIGDDKIHLSSNKPNLTGYFPPAMKASWHAFVQNKKKAEERLMQHQLDAIQEMEQRDREQNALGHFVVLDTGRGKTAIAVCYLRRFLASLMKTTANNQNCPISSILWIVPKVGVEAIAKEVPQWHCGVYLLPNNGVPVKYKINIVNEDKLRKIRETLLLYAPYMAVVVDEVDTKYAQTQRTSATKSIVDACPKRIMMTATPIRNNNHSEVAEWLGRTVNFPVKTSNWLVAASTIVFKRLDLNIEVKEVLERYPLSMDNNSNIINMYTSMFQNKPAGWIHQVAELAMNAVNDRMIDTAINYAKSEQDGGVDAVLVCACHEKHRQTLLNLFCDRNVPAGSFIDGPNENYAIIVITKNEARAYNWGIRFGALIEGVYAECAPIRRQRLGRLKRLGQKRNIIYRITIVWQNSLLELWHANHMYAENMNRSLEQLADDYDVDEWISRIQNIRH